MDPISHVKVVQHGTEPRTHYRIEVSGVVAVAQAEGKAYIDVVIPASSEDTEFITVDRTDGDAMVGVELAHGGVVVGHWPDGEEWVDRIRVPNPLGANSTAPTTDREETP